jgi:hypothetical protein
MLLCGREPDQLQIQTPDELPPMPKRPKPEEKDQPKENDEGKKDPGADGLTPDDEDPMRAVETYLIENGVVTQRSKARRRDLGCVACLWFRWGKPANPSALNACTGVPVSNAARVLQLLESGGVAVSNTEPSRTPDDTYYSGRSLYSPTDTPLGQGFSERMSRAVPEACGQREMDSQS